MTINIKRKETLINDIKDVIQENIMNFLETCEIQDEDEIQNAFNVIWKDLKKSM